MKKIAIMLFGPPGSGKGTQANLLASKFNLIHFDSGKFLESVVHDQVRQKEAIIRRERELFDAGKLNSPSFVFREIAHRAEKFAESDLGIVFSGSPRTMHEAEKLVPLLERWYGKKKIFVFELRLPPQGTLERNSKRMVCSTCGYTLLTKYYPTAHVKYCPICGGSFYRRTLDNAKVIAVRLKEYRERTEPIFDFLKKRHYHVWPIDAREAPYKVFSKLEVFLKKAA
jgi:adenylate kinase